MSESDDLDELFGEEGARPRPRTALVVTLLVVGLLLTILGLACTAAPGGLIVLAAWAVVEKEADRVENGYLPAEARTTVVWLRRAAVATLLLVIALFVVQAVLLVLGVYDILWTQVLERVVEAWSPTPSVPPPVPPTP